MKECKPTNRILSGDIQNAECCIVFVRKLEQRNSSLIFAGWCRCWGKGRRSASICVPSTAPYLSEPEKRESVKSHLKSVVPCCYLSSEWNLD